MLDLVCKLTDNCFGPNCNYICYLFIYYTKDLLERPLEKTVTLGIKYQIHDVIGADLVNW
jgi:hypothetical protein